MAATDYAWLRADCEFRMQVREKGYAGREVVPPGDQLYDPQIRWDDDGSIVISDIGGQTQRGWDPEGGYGALYRLRTDDRLEAIVPPGFHGKTAPIRPEKAPPWFGQWG